MPNPYTVRPVTSAGYFSATRGGRGAQARRILQNICRADPLPDSISLIGERRFGKTSLLRYLQAAATAIPGLHIVYIDMLGLNPLNPGGFYEMLLENLSSTENLLPEHATPGYRDFRALLRRLSRLNQRLVLLIDEFDLVVRGHAFDLSFFDNLRSAATTLPLALIVASVQPLIRIAHQAVYGSPFFNIFQEERLKLLTSQEARSLITQPPGGSEGLAEVVDAIVTLAGYHPYFLQLACHCAWDMREEAGGRLDRDALYLTFQERARNQYQYIWDHCSSPEQQVLYTLAQGASPPKDDEALSLLERGYLIDEMTLRICGTGLQAFIAGKYRLPTPDLEPDPQSRQFPRLQKLPGPATIFYAYAHVDEPFRQELEKHLSNLKLQNLVTTWHDRKIPAGAEWSQVIDDDLNAASVILLLISPDFLASDHCYGKELLRAMERHEAGEAIVIPIILRHADWQNTPLQKLRVLPDGGKPIRAWGDRDQAFLSVVRGIRLIVEQSGL